MALCNLATSVDPDEAGKAAETACAYSLELAKEYRAVRPAWFHNILVNTGVRERGLCYHWADDLAAKLATLQLRTLEIHRGVAYIHTRLEHNCVVLTPVGGVFKEGVALDAWRRMGVLRWTGVDDDDKFPWEQDLEMEQSDHSPNS